MKTMKIIILSTIVSLSLYCVSVYAEVQEMSRQAQPEKIVATVVVAEKPAQSWVDWFYSELSSTTNWFKSTFGDAAQWVGTTLGNAAQWIKDQVSDIVTSSPMTQDLYKNYGQPAVEFAIKHTASALEYVKEKGTPAYEITKEYATKVYETAADYTMKAYDKASELKDIYQKEGAQAAATWLKSQGTDVTIAIGEVLKQKFSDATAKLDELRNDPELSAKIKGKLVQLKDLTADYAKAGIDQTAEYYNKINQLTQATLRVIGNKTDELSNKIRETVSAIQLSMLQKKAADTTEPQKMEPEKRQ